MADVRSMLRKERAARQQNTGAATKTRRAPSPPPPSRKRKADDDDAEGRKRTRASDAEGLPAGFFDGNVASSGPSAVAEDEKAESPQDLQALPDQTEEIDEPAVTDPNTSVPDGFFDTGNVPVQAAGTAAIPAVNEDEWAAFEREVATPPPETVKTTSVLQAAASIEAAPVSAAELAAQAREEQSKQRGRQDVEIEAEKEDAARHLEEEFDEMEALEARVRRLREKREALRNNQKMEAIGVVPEARLVDEGDEDASDDDLDDDDWDDWRFTTL